MKWLVLLRVEINQISKYSENGSWETLTALMAGESLEDELNSFLTPLSQLGTESFLYFQCIVISIYAPWQSVVSLLIVACDGAGLIRVTVHSRWPDLAPASVRRMGTRGRRPQLMARHPLASPHPLPALTPPPPHELGPWLRPRLGARPWCGINQCCNTQESQSLSSFVKPNNISIDGMVTSFSGETEMMMTSMMVLMRIIMTSPLARLGSSWLLIFHRSPASGSLWPLAGPGASTRPGSSSWLGSSWLMLGRSALLRGRAETLRSGDTGRTLAILWGSSSCQTSVVTQWAWTSAAVNNITTAQQHYALINFSLTLNIFGRFIETESCSFIRFCGNLKAFINIISKR